MKHMLWAGVVGLALVCGARAEVQPNPLFTDGAVLQRGVTIPGWEDYRNRTGRGYVQGRWRGVHELYAEAEWRFRITSDGLLGGNVFANASTFSRPAVDVAGYTAPREKVFSTVRPAGGFGLRFMMNREARNAVTLDLGLGQDSLGIYFGAGEVF